MKFLQDLFNWATVQFNYKLNFLPFQIILNINLLQNKRLLKNYDIPIIQTSNNKKNNHKQS